MYGGNNVGFSGQYNAQIEQPVKQVARFLRQLRYGIESVVSCCYIAVSVCLETVGEFVVY